MTMSLRTRPAVGSALLGVLVLLLLARPARAREPSEPTDNVRKVELLYAEGAQLYKSGRHREALTKFLAALKLIEDANLLYNIGRTYEALGEVDKAIAAFKRCVGHAEVTPAAKKRAVDRIELLLRARAAAAAKANKRRIQPARGARDETTFVSVFRWIALGLGVGLTTAGVITYALGASDHGQIVDQPGWEDPANLLGMTRQQALDLASSGTTKKNVGVVMLGVGAASLVGSLAMFIWGGSSTGERRKAKGVRLDVASDGRGARLLLRGRF